MKGWEIVAYTYAADTYCPDDIVKAMQDHGDRYALAETPSGDAEADLDLLARESGIDREDEASFDSGDFPKVVFASQIEDDEHCGLCGGEL